MAKNLGKVTAYAHAKAGGYTGTQDEFNAMLAGLDEYNEAAAQSAEEASGYAEEASGYADNASESASDAAESVEQAASIIAEAISYTVRRFEQKFTVSSSTSSFTFNPTGYTYSNDDRFEVYVNGSKLVDDGYTNSSNVITLTTAVSSGTVEIIGFKNIDLTTDTTLSLAGVAADAKKTGDEIDALKDDLDNIEEEIASIGGLSDDAKEALLACFENVAWAVDNGQAFVSALEEALNSDSYPKIQATYTKGKHVVRAGDSLDTLKPGLDVLYYEDSSSQGQEISASNCTLSGNLVVGTSRIGVAYNGLQTSFVVSDVVSSIPAQYTAYDYIGLRPENELRTIPTFSSIDSTHRLRLATSATQQATTIWGKTYDDLWNMNCEFLTRQHTIYSSDADSSYNVLLGGRNASNFIYGFYQKTNGKALMLQQKKNNLGVWYTHTTDIYKVEVVMDIPNKELDYTYDGKRPSIAYTWTTEDVDSGRLSYFNNLRYGDNSGQTALGILNDIGILKIYDPSTLELVDEYVPAVRNADNVIGLYNTVNNTFYTTESTQYATIGNSYCIYKVGNWQ